MIERQVKIEARTWQLVNLRGKASWRPIEAENTRTRRGGKIWKNKSKLICQLNCKIITKYTQCCQCKQTQSYEWLKLIWVITCKVCNWTRTAGTCIVQCIVFIRLKNSGRHISRTSQQRGCNRSSGGVDHFAVRMQLEAFASMHRVRPKVSRGGAGGGRSSCDGSSGTFISSGYKPEIFWNFERKILLSGAF